MKVGFTGTRYGMSTHQANKLRTRLNELKPTEFHHGCCMGADMQAHRIVRGLPFPVKIIGHPPIDPMRMGICACDELREPEHFLDRNHSIVEETEHLVAAPNGYTERLRSGTWATWRYAQKIGKTTEIITP